MALGGQNTFTSSSLDAEPGWISLDPRIAVGMVRSFVSGDHSGDRLRVRYFRRERDNALVGKVWFGAGAEGPPGHAHGGSIAAVLDEAMGLGAWMAGHSVVAARLTTEFRQMLPLGTCATVETRVECVEGKKVNMHGRLFHVNGDEFATAKALFVILAPERFKDFRLKYSTG